MQLTTPVYNELRSIIQRLCGLALSEDKAYLVRHRLEPVIQRFGCNDFQGLIERLRGFPDLALADAVVDAITTKETSFFRDGHPFEVLRQHILPELDHAAQQRLLQGVKPSIRFWSAASSTGQEAYTLAILIHDYCARTGSAVSLTHFSILASDISSEALRLARAGVYSARDLQRGLSESAIQRFFVPHGSDYKVLPALRQLIDFRRLNLLSLPPALGMFDVILCRNVLIYFDEPSRRRICEALYRCLLPGGYLIVGAAESLYWITDLFTTQRLDQTTVYRRF